MTFGLEQLRKRSVKICNLGDVGKRSMYDIDLGLSRSSCTRRLIFLTICTPIHTSQASVKRLPVHQP